MLSRFLILPRMVTRLEPGDVAVVYPARRQPSMDELRPPHGFTGR